MNEQDALIAQPQVVEISGLSRTEVWRRVKSKTFPAPVRLGSRCTRWSKAEVTAWVAKQLAKRQQTEAAA